MHATVQLEGEVADAVAKLTAAEDRAASAEVATEVCTTHVWCVGGCGWVWVGVLMWQHRCVQHMFRVCVCVCVLMCNIGVYNICLVCVRVCVLRWQQMCVQHMLGVCVRVCCVCAEVATEVCTTYAWFLCVC